jgi:predicted nucleic acid-binding Zn ribbon protein
MEKFVYLNKEIKKFFESNTDLKSLSHNKKNNKKDDLFKIDVKFIQTIKTYRLFAEWEKIVGVTVSAQSEPIKLENKILYIRVSNPSWKTELKYMSRDLIKKIKDVTDLEIKHIRTV